MYDKKDNIALQADIQTGKEDTPNAFYHVYDRSFFSLASPEIFTHSHWQAKGAITGQAKGRGVTWFFKHKGSELVLRHYYRGGLISRLLTDLYFFRGLEQTRAYRECELLNHMARLGLPVPRPIAFQVQRRHFCYCVSDIIMSRITGGTDLVSLLQERPMSTQELLTIGHTVRRFHDKNVFHHDLNAHNVLLDTEHTAWLVDFDQGEIRSRNTSWKQNNLNRLRESLQKERARLESFHWEDCHWQHILTGYQQATEIA